MLWRWDVAFSPLGWAGGSSAALVLPFLLPAVSLCCELLWFRSLGLFSRLSGFALVLDNLCLLLTKRCYGHKLPCSRMRGSAPCPDRFVSSPPGELCFARSKSHQLQRLPTP